MPSSFRGCGKGSGSCWSRSKTISSKVVVPLAQMVLLEEKRERGSASCAPSGHAHPSHIPQRPLAPAGRRSSRRPGKAAGCLELEGGGGDLRRREHLYSLSRALRCSSRKDGVAALRCAAGSTSASGVRRGRGQGAPRGRRPARRRARRSKGRGGGKERKGSPPEKPRSRAATAPDPAGKEEVTGLLHLRAAIPTSSSASSGGSASPSPPQGPEADAGT
jgi:hypothetical protein